MPKMSVIVPMYNVETYIRDCIDSIVMQTLGDIEIILVDDGTPDKSGAIADEYAAADARIRVYHKENGGVGAARNDGLKLATGEYVIFCDGDDFMEPDACETLYRAAKEQDADVAVGDVYRIMNGEKVYAQFWRESFTARDQLTLDALVKVDFSRKYCHDAPKEGPAFGYGGPWNKAVRREFLLEKGIAFDESLKGIFDDILYTAYLYAEASCVTYVTQPVYDYRILDDSVTHSYKADMPQINEAIFAAWKKFLLKYGRDGRFMDAYYTLVIRRLKGLLGAYFFHPDNPMSLSRQKKYLKRLLHTQPYHAAVNRADPAKLINPYDLAVWAAAKAGSVTGLQAVYKAFCIVKKS